MLAAYYVGVGLTALLAWPHAYGAQSSARTWWLVLGGFVVVAPLLIPGRPGIYFGLAGNSTVFFWAADTHMDPYWRTSNRRRRSIVGGALVVLLPIFFGWPLETWAGALLIPTVGHLLLTGIATPLVRHRCSPQQPAPTVVAGTIESKRTTIDEALTIVLKFNTVVSQSRFPPRLRDLPHSREDILNALMVLYAVLQRESAREFITREYPREFATYILSSKFGSSVKSGIEALPEFLSDQEADVLQRFSGAATTEDRALAEQAMAIRTRQAKERLHFMQEAMKLNAD